MDDTLTGEGMLTAFGRKLQGVFEDDKRERLEQEGEWLKDLRQYTGEHPPELQFEQNQSQAFVRLTRVKVKAMDARLGELASPSVTDGWDISPTSVPSLPATAEKALALAYAQDVIADGGQPTKEGLATFMEEAVKVYATEAAKKMKLYMKDALEEMKFWKLSRKVYNSGHVYGLGILKGPLVRDLKETRWEWNEQAKGFDVLTTSKPAPYAEHTSVWDLFADMTAPNLYESDHYFQRHLWTKYTTLRLTASSGFNRAAVAAHLREYPKGDAEWSSYDRQVLGIGRHDPSAAKNAPSRRYEVLEYWGLADGEDLVECGLELDSALQGEVLEVTAWMFAKTGVVFKLSLNPLSKNRRPYSFYVPEPEEGKAIGVGVPWISRDTQGLFNAAVRMAVDNAAPAVRPQYVMDRKVLAGNKDPRDLSPGRVWGAEYEPGYTGKPLDMITAPLHTNTFIQLANFFRALNDEGTGIPAYQHGERGVGVGRTAGGLAMLMGASNLGMRESFKAWDEMMAVFLEGLYDWYMQFGKDETIKGDFAVVVSGANAILARDALIEKLEAFAAATINPGDIPFVDRYELVKIRAEVLGLPAQVVKSEKDLEAEAAAQQAVLNQPQGGENAGQASSNGGLPQGGQGGLGTGSGQGSAPIPAATEVQGPGSVG